MSELKAIDMIVDDDYKTKVYIKSEADKVIADLEESHKKEVEQLLIEIVKLKKQVHEYAQGMYVIQARAEKEARHHKYKRCLAMALICERVRFEFKGLFWSTSEVELRTAYSIKIKQYSKWHKRWLELAEKFKTN